MRPILNDQTQIVSDDSELLILVDSDDQAIGHLDKAACHDGAGTLHRAFSLFIFNATGALLLQRRAEGKRLWPGYWSNSCCSHPRQGESMDVAVARRCRQELGFETRLQFVYKFEYQASFGELGSEHELCSVYVGRYEGQVMPNKNEVSAHEWVAPDQIDARLQNDPDVYTPWFKLEWQRLRTDYPSLLP